jgi:beta-glucanase (GH16 family)
VPLILVVSTPAGRYACLVLFARLALIRLQVMETAFALIDADTPESAYTYTSLEDGSQWQLVFSDEFNQDGRSFYPGDDPFWEAHDLHYWLVALPSFNLIDIKRIIGVRTTWNGTTRSNLLQRMGISKFVWITDPTTVSSTWVD